MERSLFLSIMRSFAVVAHLTAILSYAAFVTPSEAAEDLDEPRSNTENQTTNSSDTTLIRTPGRTYVNMAGVLSVFVWKIEGTSLDQLRLDCGEVGTIARVNNVTNGSTVATLTLTLGDEDHVTCNLTDGEEVLDTRTINIVEGRIQTCILFTLLLYF